MFANDAVRKRRFHAAKENFSQIPPAQGCRLVSSFCAETFGYATSSVPTFRWAIDCALLYRPYGNREISHILWDTRISGTTRHRLSAFPKRDASLGVEIRL